MVLADVAQGKQRHVPYRDSRLTFLLQVRNTKTSYPFVFISSSSISSFMCIIISGFTWWQLQNHDYCKCQPFNMVHKKLFPPHFFFKF